MNRLIVKLLIALSILFINCSRNKSIPENTIQNSIIQKDTVVEIQNIDIEKKIDSVKNTEPISKNETKDKTYFDEDEFCNSFYLNDTTFLLGFFENWQKNLPPYTSEYISKQNKLTRCAFRRYCF